MIYLNSTFSIVSPTLHLVLNILFVTLAKETVMKGSNAFPFFYTPPKKKESPLRGHSLLGEDQMFSQRQEMRELNKRTHIARLDWVSRVIFACCC